MTAGSTAPAPGSASTAYQVVARRYRPQRFDELVGQEHVARGLSGAIESGRIGHAYLFTGARGVGKTSAARIYAKALECAAGPAAEPCNACDPCRAIAAGQDVDVVEIDAASNRGIDEIRQLRQNVAVRPARGRFKIYIIDEVHMLTREAFNALLKTLEEPPAHVKFVLCTTEPEKLPITILSRCQRFDFVTVDPPAIARRLGQIVAAEGADVAPAALDLIARRAAGSMRDSQSLLEQLLGARQGPIGVDEVHAMIGTGREERIGTLLRAIAGRDPAAAIVALDEALGGGADPGGVLDQLVAALRDALVASVGGDRRLLTQGDGLGIDLVVLGGEVGTATLLAMLQILDQSLTRMRSSGHPQVLAEMAVVRLAALEDLDALAAAVDRLSGSAPATAAAPREKKTTELTPAAAEPRRPAASADGPAPQSRPVAPQPSAATAATPAVAAAEPSVALPPLPEEPLAAWLAAAAAVGGLAHDFAATAVRAGWNGDLLEVVLPAAGGTSAAFLRRPETTATLVRTLSDMAGRGIRIAIATAPPESVAAAPPRPTSATSAAALVREAAEHPLVAHARTLFDAAIVRVEPGRPSDPAVAPPTAVAAPAREDDELDHDTEDLPYE